MREKDITEKTLEAYDDVFADIVNGLLFHGEQIVDEQKLTDAQPFSLYKAEGQIREQDRDIAKYWTDESGERINVRIAFLGIENQTRTDRDMVLRVIGYDGAAYRAQLDQKDRYPVITLVLYFGDEAWGKKVSLYDTIPIPARIRPYVSDYRINVFEIARLPEEAVGCFRSDFRIVADYFIHRRTNPDYRPRDPVKFKHVDEVLKLLSAMTQDRRFEETLNREGGKPENMCEVLDRVEARGIEIGIERGIEQGIEQGIERGIEQGVEKSRMESIRNVMHNLQLTAVEAMDALGIPASDREKYSSRL